ncbi:hypothetical protein RF11_13183 [Thelohanellus kitauei]|uniref:Uncharacterized protein n=1 Tax=Thelohanellus kitauei TaxID=669202 RepID=A0A0C2MUC6_THEKT|nr:hypothetical protein RF11_13183 [Thelohanellus kitauei]
MKDTTTGEDIFKDVENASLKMELPWQKMKICLLKRMSDHVAEVDSNKELIFLHCIIHKEILCQGVLDMKHLVDPIVKIVNFIRQEWLSDLAFAVYLFEHIKELNTKLQGNGVFAYEMYNVVKALKVKLKLFSRHLSQNIMTHFPTLKTMVLQITSTKKSTNTRSKLSGDFGILQSPFTSDFVKAPAALQLELIDLQCDISLTEKFKSESIEKIYASLNESKFINLRKMAMKILRRSNLTGIRVQSLLRISTSNLEPEFEQIFDNVDIPQMSH